MAKFCIECGKETQGSAAFCTECGAKFPVDFQPEANPETVKETVNTVPEIKTEPKAELKAETPPVVPANVTQSQAAQPQPQVYQQPQAAQPQPQVYQQPQVAQPQPQVYQQPQVAQPQPQVYQQPQAAQPQPQVNRTQQVYTTPPQTTHSQPVAAAPAVDPTNKMVKTGTYFGLMLLFALPVVGFISCIIMCFAPKNMNLKHFARANLIWAIIAMIIGALLMGGLYLLSNSLLDYINQTTNGQFGGWGELFGDLSELERLVEQFNTIDLESLPVE